MGLTNGQHTDGRTADPKTEVSRRLLLVAEAKNWRSGERIFRVM